MFLWKVAIVCILILVGLVATDAPINQNNYCLAEEVEVISYQDPLVDQLAEVILSHHQTINRQQIELSYEEAREAANEIVYLVDEYDMDRQEDIPRILSLFYQESKFDCRAENSQSSAKGIGQILMSLHSDKIEQCGVWQEPACNIFVAFQIFSYNSSIEDPRTRWINALTGYCGSRSAAISSLRHTPIFQRELMM